MAHAFDTGIPRPQRTLIRSGAVTLLAELLRSNGGYLQAVEGWGGVCRGYTDEVGRDQIFQLLVGRAPAIVVAVGDQNFTPAGVGGFTFKGEIDLLVYFASQHLRGEARPEGRMASDVTALASDLADPGLDVMMEHATELLVGAYPGAVPTVKRCIPRSEEEVSTAPELTLWMQRYTVIVDRVINANRGITQLLESLRSQARVSVDPDPTKDPIVTGATTVIP